MGFGEAGSSVGRGAWEGTTWRGCSWSAGTRLPPALRELETPSRETPDGRGSPGAEQGGSEVAEAAPGPQGGWFSPRSSVLLPDGMKNI